MRMRSIGLGWIWGLGLGLAGCSGLEPVTRYAPITDPTQLYMRLVLNHRAITLSTVAPYDTLQLTATPLDGTGAPMTGLPAPTFTSSDSTHLKVTPEGVLQARGSARKVRVIASLTIPGNLRHADTAVVNVNATTNPPPTLGSVSLHSDPDTTTVSLLVDNHLAVLSPFRPMDWYVWATAQDPTGANLSNVAFDYRSLDPGFVQLDPDQYGHAIRPGSGRIVAEATAYGVTLADTLVYTITWRNFQLVNIGFQNSVGPLAADQILSQENFRLAPNGIVLWESSLKDSVDIVFDDPTNVGMPPANICDRLPTFRGGAYFGPGPHCGTGDVLVPGVQPKDSLPPGSSLPLLWTVQLRQFPVPGVYKYHSTRLGVSGQIVVTDDPDPTALP